MPTYLVAYREIWIMSHEEYIEADSEDEAREIAEQRQEAGIVPSASDERLEYDGPDEINIERVKRRDLPKDAAVVREE